MDSPHRLHFRRGEASARRRTHAERKRDSAQPQEIIPGVGPTLRKGVGEPEGCKEAAARRRTDAERKRDSAQPQEMIPRVGPTPGRKGVGEPEGCKECRQSAEGA